MPDGNKPELPLMDVNQLAEYLDALKADFPRHVATMTGVAQWAAPGGSVTASYSTPGDTTVTWKPITEDHSDD